MPKNKKPINSDIFFVSFIDQEVELHLETVITETKTTEDGLEQFDIPLVYMGYLTDYDEDYYYLGENIGEIQQAVKRTTVINITLVKPYNGQDELLDNLKTPVDPNRFN